MNIASNNPKQVSLGLQSHQMYRLALRLISGLVIGLLVAACGTTHPLPQPIPQPARRRQSRRVLQDKNTRGRVTARSLASPKKSWSKRLRLSKR